MSTAAPTDAGRKTFLLTFDFEDWHQLVYHQIGRADWRIGDDAFPGHISRLLEVLDELGVHATFFVTGVTAERHPEALGQVVAKGHEIGCHGHEHVRVFEQTRDEFRRDVVRCVEVVERICGVTPVGYRAPWCSITRETQWAHDVLRDLGFLYDSSLFDSPRVPNRIQPIPRHPYGVRGDADTLWEFPLAVCRWGRLVLPVGGGAYWRVLPSAVLRRALDDVSRQAALPVLYFHPYEFAPEPLRIGLPRRATSRERIRESWRYVWQNTRRLLIEPRLRETAARFRLVPVRDIYPAVADDSDTGRGAAPEAATVMHR
jgi:polysaccharide deacetylase family protein (PEP-CTERM system associated)